MSWRKYDKQGQKGFLDKLVESWERHSALGSSVFEPREAACNLLSHSSLRNKSLVIKRIENVTKLAGLILKDPHGWCLKRSLFVRGNKGILGCLWFT